MVGDYAALLTFTAHYGHPLAIYQCPDLAVFQVSHPSAIICPFSEVPPPILQRGHELQLLMGASSASQPGGLASASLLSHSPPQGSSRGHNPPSIAAATRASSPAVFRNASLPPPPRRPDPDGVDGPSSVFGGMGGLGGPHFVGRSSSSYGFYPSRSSFSSGFSTSSTAEHYRQVHFPAGTIPEAVPTVVFGGDHHPPPPGGFRHAPLPPDHNHHAPASVASASALAASPLHPLSQDDLSASSASDLTTSFLASNTPPVAIPSAPNPPPPGVNTPAPVPPAPTPSFSPLVIPPNVVPLRPSDPFKLPVIKDTKAYLDVHDMIQYYLRQPEYATQRSNDALVTTPSNVVASLFWEGQLRNAVREGSLHFLFDNKGTLYHGKGFEMLAVLDQHCCPDTISNAFSTLMSLFNDIPVLAQTLDTMPVTFAILGFQPSFK
jgi:hypothetical protein